MKIDPRNGLVKILDSAKGVMSLIILTVSSVLCGLGKVDGNSYALIVGSVSTVFLAAHSFVNASAIKASAAVQAVVVKPSDPPPKT